MASISEPFIRRPVGTTLLAIGLFLVGMVAYIFLPVSAVPNVDFPVIRVFATRPGADPPARAWTAPRFEMVAAGPVHAGVDGEAVDLPASLEFVIRPAALRARISRRHPGVSPSGRLP